jgi:hypothetical protein
MNAPAFRDGSVALQVLLPSTADQSVRKRVLHPMTAKSKAKDKTPNISTKLKLVKEMRRHLLLTPEEYRLLLRHVVQDHLASKRPIRRDDQHRAAA